jgi:protein-S-isoprenylcysteine O-methyltransferase Ste14
MKEQKGNRISNILIGIALTWMILLPTIIRLIFNEQKEMGNFFLFLGIAVGFAGNWIRIAAITHLGRFYSRNVSVQSKHVLIQDGWYRFIRHPGYLGTFLTYLGFAISTSSILAVCINIALFMIAYSYRISVEEKTLMVEFGDDYQRYKERTWRMIPFIF